MNKYVKYLRDKTKNEKLVDRFKIVLRPLIFPMDLLLSQIKKEDKVFDIGCGSGQFLLVVSEFINPVKLFGIEIKDLLINNANNLFSKFQKDADFNFLKYDGNDIPSELKDYNKVFMNDVLHHIPKEKQELFISKVYESMSHNSTFILKDIDASSFLVYFNKLHDLIFSGEIGNELSFEKAKTILTENGFTDIKGYKKRIFWYSHYVLICKKE